MRLLKRAAVRYDGVAITLHWLIAAALTAQSLFGWFMDDIAARGTPARAGVVNLHKSLGLVLGALIVARLLWRLAHRPPPWPATVPARQQALARLGHGALYAAMLLQPLSGYVASNFSKYGVRFFGHPLPPWAPESRAAYAYFNGLHQTLGWVLALMVAGHVALALKHALVDRDGLFGRIWPPRAG
ncbi:MAG: cytochrome b [Burkholderiales bacterium]|nr:cytochrome b [Burkholderiales bacterium]MDE2276790.1 cytochrome b [Burkholderiales bacterium]